MKTQTRPRQHPYREGYVEDDRRRWDGGEADYREQEDYNRAARHFYNKPASHNSAVLETVYRKPKVFADLHEYDEVPDIDRVPTAIGFHSLDSADEFVEARSKHSRYDYEEEQELEPDEPPSQVYDLQANMSDEDNDDRYGMKNETMKSVWSNDTDSCPAVWRSFSEEKEEKGANWALEEARRRRELNSVKVPEKTLLDQDFFPSEIQFGQERRQQRAAEVDNRGNRSRRSNMDERTQTNDKSATKGAKKELATNNKKGWGLKALVRGGGGGGTSMKSSSNKSKRTQTSKNSQASKNSKGSNSRGSNSKGSKSAPKTTSKSVPTTASKARIVKRANQSSQNMPQESEKTIETTSKFCREGKAVDEENSRQSSQSGSRPSTRSGSRQSIGKTNEKLERPKKRGDVPVKEAIVTKQAKDVEDSSEGSTKNSRSMKNSNKLTETSKNESIQEAMDNDDLIMAVRGQSEGDEEVQEADRFAIPELKEEPKAKEIEPEVPVGFSACFIAGFERLANIGFKEPMPFLDWSGEERKIAAFDNDGNNRTTNGDDEDGPSILEAQNDDNSTKERMSLTLDGSEPSKQRLTTKAQIQAQLREEKKRSAQMQVQLEEKRRHGRPVQERTEREGDRASSRERNRGSSSARRQDESREYEVRDFRSRNSSKHKRQQINGDKIREYEQRSMQNITNDEGAPTMSGSRSVHSIEVKSLQLDGEANDEGVRHQREQREEPESSLSTARDGLSITTIEIPTPNLVTLQQEDDGSISILGLAKKTSRSKRVPTEDVPEERVPTHVPSDLKKGKPSFMGKFLTRR